MNLVVPLVNWPYPSCICPVIIVRRERGEEERKGGRKGREKREGGRKGIEGRGESRRMDHYDKTGRVD